MPQVFISYRRADSVNWADELHEHLARHFGHKNVVIDVEDIPHGADFTDFIGKSIRRVDAVVVVIGRTWATVTDEAGEPRIHNPNDLLHREIATALLIGIDVFPVLVDGAVMPSASDLPQDLQRLARLNAIEIGIGTRFKRDVGQLVRAIEDRTGANRLAVLVSNITNHTGSRWLVAAGIFAVGAATLLFISSLLRDPAGPPIGAGTSTIEPATTMSTTTTPTTAISTSISTTSTSISTTSTSISTTSTSTSTTSATTTTTTQLPLVVEVVPLSLQFRLTCPRSVTVAWEVIAVEGAGEVSYQVNIDDDLGKKTTVSISSPGSIEVTSEPVEVTSDNSSRTAELEILNPSGVASSARTVGCLSLRILP